MRAPDGTVSHAYAAIAELLDVLSVESLITSNVRESCYGGSASPSRFAAKTARPNGFILFDLIARSLPMH
jgi:hypothetical protein